MSKDSALLVIDVQVGMFEEPEPMHAGDLLLERIGHLITKARSSGVPVIYVQHNEGPGAPLETNAPGWHIHPDIAPVEGDVVIQKRTPDAFHHTNLHDELQKTGVRNLVLAGLQTEICIDTTCRRASSLGYDVVLAKDAHSTWNRGNLKAADIIDHHNDLLQWFARVEDTANIVF